MGRITYPKVIAAIFTLSLLGMQTNANADGLYFGAGAYLTEANYETLDETDQSLSFLVGYNLIDSNFFLFSVELGAHDLGEYSDGGIEVDADAVSLSAVGGIPIGPFIEIYGKIGVAQVDVKVNNDDFDGSEAFFAAGIALDILDTIDFYLEYVEFDTEVDSRSIGVGIKLDLF